jgi:hypothetical protein
VEELNLLPTWPPREVVVVGPMEVAAVVAVEIMEASRVEVQRAAAMVEAAVAATSSQV